MTNSAAKNLSENIKRLRSARGMTQSVLAKNASIPRATLAFIETGTANPTMNVLTKISSALQASLDELLSPPRAVGKLYSAAQFPSSSKNGIRLSHLLPDHISGISIERMDLEPMTHRTGVPHKIGTREYLAVLKGEVFMAVEGETWTLKEGDVLVFRGDQRHGYKNPSRSHALAISVILTGSNIL
jgi:transcriptional regulator with XRE-family HTH domain